VLTVAVNQVLFQPREKGRAKREKGFATAFVIQVSAIVKIAHTPMPRTPHRHPTRVKVRANVVGVEVPKAQEAAATLPVEKVEATALGGDRTAETERSSNAGISRTESASMETNALISMVTLLRLLQLKRRTTKRRRTKNLTLRMMRKKNR
jgi:hypothetical protein